MTKQPTEAGWQRAAGFAARWHQGQVRRDGRTPYVAHPFRVAMTLRHVFGIDDEVALTAAILHDVIEDTGADYDDVAEEFGAQVADVVAALTKDMRLPEPQREPAYDRQLAQAAWQAKAIKLADVYDNYCDWTPDKSERILDRARRAITIAGDERRLARAVAIVQDLISP